MKLFISIGYIVQLKNNSGQVAWLAQKQLGETKEINGYQTFQEFLDKCQYSVNGILRYEKIFGPGLLSNRAFCMKIFTNTWYQQEAS